jgi:hypothetical protein
MLLYLKLALKASQPVRKIVQVLEGTRKSTPLKRSNTNSHSLTLETFLTVHREKGQQPYKWLWLFCGLNFFIQCSHRK